MITASEARARSDNGSYERTLKKFESAIETAIEAGTRSFSIGYGWGFGRICSPRVMNKVMEKLKENGYTVTLENNIMEINGVNYQTVDVHVEW